jgi:hypothetical protein
MKKITSIIAMACLSTLAFAQTQRVELYEEFTGENCGPCAATNPGLNALLFQYSNPSKIISIKYESPIPSSAGPASLYGQNQPEVDSRITYYSVPFAPYARFDGIQLPDTTGAGNNGHAGILEQYIIDTASKVNAPFSIVMTHSFSPIYDSVFVHMVITASEAYTANGALYARIALEEAAIHLPAPSGSNGEKDFYYTMRKMLPDPTGSALPATWTNGQVFTLDIRAKVPSYIYDKEQICFVGFVQSDGDKKVQQAALSAPVQMTLDAGVTSVFGVPAVQCTTSYTAQDTVRNYGSTTMTSCTINYQLDGGTIMTQSWTGSIPSGGTGVMALPTGTTVVGSHTLKVWTSNPNGSTDYNPGNDAATMKFNIEGTAAVSPLVEGFQSTFPPAGWALENIPASLYTWSKSTACGSFGNSTASTRMDFYDAPAGNICNLYLHNVDLSSSATTAALTFDVAYAPYDNTTNDQLDIEVSSDCGVTWANVYSKNGAGLSTAPGLTTAAFVPTKTQWRTEAVNLNANAGKTNVIIRFKATSAYGNDMYVDNVNLSNSQLGIAEHNLQDAMNVYPNPFTDNVNISFVLAKTENVKLSVYNMLGELVYSAEKGSLPSGSNTIEFNGSELSKGIYFIQLNAGNFTASKKVSVSK